MALLTQYRSFFISPFGEPSACDDLNGFLKAHRIVNIEKRLIDGERGTGWLFLVEYTQDGRAAGAAAPGAGGVPGPSAPRVDYREILSAQEFALFDKLRRLRKDLAEKQGLPVYAVFSNEQLATMIKHNVKTVKDLAAIPGIGDAKIKQYSGAFLKLLAEYVPPADAAPAEETPRTDADAAGNADAAPGPEAPGAAPELAL